MKKLMRMFICAILAFGLALSVTACDFDEANGGGIVPPVGGTEEGGAENGGTEDGGENGGNDDSGNTDEEKPSQGGNNGGNDNQDPEEYWTNNY